MTHNYMKLLLLMGYKFTCLTRGCKLRPNGRQPGTTRDHACTVHLVINLSISSRASSLD